MKITVLSALLLAVLSPTALGQEGDTYGTVNLSGPDINDAYSAATACISLANDSPKSVETIQIQASADLECTFYSKFDCEDEQTTLGSGGHDFNPELIVGSWKCTLPV
ncbi:uncharacterized protein KD926_004155 [Aspergillus affinis]|uniref:uncharacterized protein n=1 Tax=Aspergillus affinis TaxID=1070780 RepID=UPI0022FE87DF|nr:uncharacterized protein KD926_004155 [Aspergillus affinis]KAI9046317.1 hypothetical protein KD926_004155 [Aspergillus affinis]